MPARRDRQQQQQQQQQQPPGPPWQAVHRYAFVQHLMGAGCMRKAAALEKFGQLTGTSSEQPFQDMVAAQNDAMRPLGFEIRTLKHPVDKQAYVAFVNKLDDEPSKLATHYKHGQREFFKHVLAAIAADPQAVDGVGSASSIALLNLDLSQPVGGQEPSDAQRAAAAEARKLTKADREATLRRLADERWLQHSPTRSGHFCIGPRTFLELADLLLSLEKPAATQAAWETIL